MCAMYIIFNGGQFEAALDTGLYCTRVQYMIAIYILFKGGQYEAALDTGVYCT